MREQVTSPIRNLIEAAHHGEQLRVSEQPCADCPCFGLPSLGKWQSYEKSVWPRQAYALLCLLCETLPKRWRLSCSERLLGDTASGGAKLLCLQSLDQLCQLITTGDEMIYDIHLHSSSLALLYNRSGLTLVALQEKQIFRFLGTCSELGPDRLFHRSATTLRSNDRSEYKRKDIDGKGRGTLNCKAFRGTITCSSPGPAASMLGFCFRFEYSLDSWQYAHQFHCGTV